MEVRSEPGMMPSREQFSAAMPKSPGPTQPPSPQLPSPTMRLAYTSDGTVVYKPITIISPHPPTKVSGGPASTNASTEVGNVSLPPPSMPSREQFSAAMPKSPGPAHPPPPPQQLPSQTMRLTYTSDGTIVYKPITTSSPHPTNQVSSGPASTNAPTEVGNGSLPPPLMPNVRMTYTPCGMPVYKPVPTSSPSTYQGGGGGPGGSNAVTEAGNGSLPAISPPPVLNINIGEPLKRKRGRPRKYGPDGTMALALIPAPHTQPGAGGFSPSSGGTTTPLSSASAEATRKAKGRPLGSGKKQQMASLGSAGTGFTPHVITVKTGEDVSSKVMSFSQQGPRAVCVLSANGAISNVTLRQPATSGGTVTYEGRFEILSLSGSFMLSVSENGGQRSRTGGLSVSLAGPDGRVLGGGVAGQLTAASPVQVVVGSFIADGKKEPKPARPSNPIFIPGNLAPSGPIAPSSPSSRGTQSESSGGPGSPLNQSTGTCNNSNVQDMSTPWK